MLSQNGTFGTSIPSSAMGWTGLLAAIGALVATTAGMHSRQDKDTHALLFLIDDLCELPPPSPLFSDCDRCSI